MVVLVFVSSFYAAIILFFIMEKVVYSSLSDDVHDVDKDDDEESYFLFTKLYLFSRVLYCVCLSKLFSFLLLVLIFFSNPYLYINI